MKPHSLSAGAVTVTAAASCMAILLGCSDAVHDVGALSDDALAATIDVSQCQNLDCDVRPDSQPLEQATVTACDPGLARIALQTPGYRFLPTGDPRIGGDSVFLSEEEFDQLQGDELPIACVSGCQQLRPHLALTPNDAAWFTGVYTPDQGQAVGVLLSYFPGTTGEATAFRTFFRYRQDDEFAGLPPYIDSRVAASPSGDAAVLIITREASLPSGDDFRYRLMRFDEQGTSLHTPIDFTHVGSVAAMDFDAEGNLYLVFASEASEQSAVAKLDSSFELMWLQSRGPGSLFDALIGPDGAVTREGAVTTEAGGSMRTLTRLADTGTVLWERTYEFDRASSASARYFATDSDGQLVRASHFSTHLATSFVPVSVGVGPRLRVEKFDADANPLWQMEMPIDGGAEGFLNQTSTSAVLDDEGGIYVAVERGVEALPAVARIAPDGTECALVVVNIPAPTQDPITASLPVIDQLALTSDGSLYVLGQGGLGIYHVNDPAFTLGRLAPAEAAASD